MDNGRIAETGTHEELIRMENGIYKNLNELQGI
jgi:ABC-type multidrug transport system fused ATPase/permease subunit